MSKVVNDYPDLKGFEQHGVLFTSVQGGQAIGSCPLCRKSDKFFVNVKNKLWDCKRCGLKGNLQKFFAEVQARKETKNDIVVRKRLAADRGLNSLTLKRWGVRFDGKQFTIPVTDATGKVIDLRRYKIGGKAMASKGGKSGLLTPKEKYNSSTVWICEGEWDSMALEEALRKIKVKQDVYGICGAGNFPKGMADHFARKNVIFVFDNDEPGNRGMTRAWNLLEGFAEKRQCVKWSESLPEGFDVRDLYLEEKRRGKTTLNKLKKMLVSTPPVDATATTQATLDEKEPTGRGKGPKFAEKAFSKWLDMPGYEVLDVLFGSIFANRIDADPLWMFLVAPSGGMKSELLMSLSEAPKIFCTTSITPHALISGANFGGGDPSLIPKLLGKCLIIKDFTAILTLNQMARDEILGILRDAYDGRTEKVFGNNVIRRYRGKFGIVAGVTPKIDDPMHQMSILGERFIKYRIRQRGKINVGRNAIRRALDNITKESNMRQDLMDAAAQVLDRSVTEEDTPDLPDWFKDKALELGQWVSAMRGCVSRDRFSQRVMFKPTAEIGTRLAKQFCILGLGIGVYRRKKVLDDDIYKIIRHVARDTAPDQVEEIIKQMYVNLDDEYGTTDEIARLTRQPVETCRYLLQDLNLLHVVTAGKRRRGTWKLHSSLLKMMKNIGLYGEEKAWKKEK